MENKFENTEQGQTEAIAYLIHIGALGDVLEVGQLLTSVNRANAVVWANYKYNLLNPEVDKRKMTYYELHGIPQPSKSEMENELREKYKDLTEEDIRDTINDSFYGGKDE